MRKVMVDCGILGLVFGLPLAGYVLTLPFGSLSLLALLPICTGVLVIYGRHLCSEFFFEEWVRKYPGACVPILILLAAAITCCEMQITLMAAIDQAPLPVTTGELLELEEPQDELNTYEPRIFAN